MPEFAVQPLLKTPTVAIRDVYCLGSHRHQSAEESTATTQLVFPYRGVFVRHQGSDQAVAEANQVLFFNATEGYRVSHPVPGGDASLTVVISESLLREMAPRALLRDGAALAFQQQRLRIDPRAQALVALLRHSLWEKIARASQVHCAGRHGHGFHADAEGTNDFARNPGNDASDAARRAAR